MYIFKVYRISEGRSRMYAFIAYIQRLSAKVFKGIDRSRRLKTHPTDQSISHKKHYPIGTFGTLSQSNCRAIPRPAHHSSECREKAGHLLPPRQPRMEPSLTFQ
jgi:hypothetical protein